MIIEHGTVLETCAIDALLVVTHKDHDMWRYETDDIGAWVDFQKYQKARSKAMQREFMQRYG